MVNTYFQQNKQQQNMWIQKEQHNTALTIIMTSLPVKIEPSELPVWHQENYVAVNWQVSRGKYTAATSKQNNSGIKVVLIFGIFQVLKDRK